MTVLQVLDSDSWRATVGRLFYPLEVERIGRGFGASVTIGPEARGVTTAEVRAAPNRLVRTPALVRRAPSDDLLLLVQRSGSSTVRQADRSVRLTTGAATLCDPITPYLVSTDVMSVQTVVTMPRSVVRALAAPVDALRLRPVPADVLPLRALLGVTDVLVEADGGQGAAELDLLAGTVIDLVRATLLRVAGSPSPTGDDAVVRQVLEHIRRQAADPGLDPETLAAAFEMSARRLASLLGPGRSPSRLIRGERLRRARERLLDPLDSGRSIAEIASSCGFTDPTTFTRAFRREFDHLPSELTRPAAPGAVGHPCRSSDRRSARSGRRS